MADNVPITPGSGASIATDDVGGQHYQRVKLDGGGDGASAPVLGDSTNGLDVDVTRVQGVVTVQASAAIPVSDDSGSLTVDDGGSSLTVDTAQLPSALANGRLKVEVDTIPGANLPVYLPAGVTSLPVSCAQLPAGLTGGRLDVHIGNITTGLPLPTGAAGEHVTAVSPHAARLSDGSAFYDAAKTGQLPAALVGGRLDVNVGNTPAITGTVTSNQGSAGSASAPWNVILRDGSGNERGTLANPIRVEPAGSSAFYTNDSNLVVVRGQDGATMPTWGLAIIGRRSDTGVPRTLRCDGNGLLEVSDGGGSLTVDGSVTANQGGAPWSQNVTQLGGVALGHANPMRVEIVPHQESAQWRTANTYAASETDIAIRTPGAGKKFVVCGLIITVTGAGVLKIYDGTNAAANMLFQGNPPVGVHAIMFATPWTSSTANNVLRYSTSSGAAGDITVFGYEV